MDSIFGIEPLNLLPIQQLELQTDPNNQSITKSESKLGDRQSFQGPYELNSWREICRDDTGTHNLSHQELNDNHNISINS